MIKPSRNNTTIITALAAVMFVQGASAQDFGSSVFSEGGGLLLEPVDPLVSAPGSISAQGTGAAGGQGGAQGPDGGAVDQGTGPVITLGLSFGYAYEDDDGEPTESFLESTLSAGVFTETRNQTFDLNFAFDIEAGDLGTGSSEIEIADPSLRLDYTLQNRDIRFDTDLIWREADVGNTFLPAAFDADDLVIDGGTQETQEARFRLETGRTARFGTTTRLEFRQRDFFDTVDPSLVDETRTIVGTDLRFTLSRRAELQTFASWTQTEEDDAINTVDTDIRYGASLEVLLDRSWTGNFQVARTDEETETTLGTTEQDTYDITASATRFMPNGQLTFSAAYQEDGGDNTLTSLDVVRALEMANGAALTAGIGLGVFDNGDVISTATLRYNQEILRGRTLSLALTREGGFSDDDDSVIRTTFNVSYAQELTRVSRLNLTTALADLEDRGAGDDTLAVSLGITYAHDLTEDWSLQARADRRINYTNGNRTDSVDQFSIALQRTFSFRP